jgi:hypothetical protein
MQHSRWPLVVGTLLVAAAAVRGQVVGGVMSVTQAHMS